LREHTEIELNEDCDFDLIKDRKVIAFDYNFSKLDRTKYLGNPISIENNILKLNTQMYYEGIPLKEVNTGSNVVIFTNSRKEIFLGTGVVKSKYFINSTKQNLKREKRLDEDNCDLILIDITLNKEERTAFALGDTPLSNDDKWVMYVSENIFHYHRVATGIEIFRGELINSNNSSDDWIIKEVLASREWKSSIEEKKQLISTLINFGIKRRLKLYQ